MEQDCKELLKDCPEWLSLEQFRVVTHISKRKAKWLLENGVIPCEDSGKHTRRFQIRLADVLEYLRRQDAGELNTVIPVGAFNSQSSSPQQQTGIEPEELFSFLMEEWAGASDMLTSKQAAELTGYNDNTVNNWAAGGKVKYINYYGKHIISKESLAKYLSSLEGQRIARSSRKHQDIIEAYMDRGQNSGMEFGSMSL